MNRFSQNLAKSACFALLLILTQSACPQGETTVVITDYDQSCREDPECIAVNTRRICGCDQTAAINRSDYDKYQQDAAEAAKSCPIESGIEPRAQIKPCYPVEAYCTANNVCATRSEGAMMPQ